jgi:hypothetical protein
LSRDRDVHRLRRPGDGPKLLQVGAGDKPRRLAASHQKELDLRAGRQTVKRRVQVGQDLAREDIHGAVGDVEDQGGEPLG